MSNNKQQTAVDSIIEFCQKQMDNDSSIHKGVYLSIIKFCKEQITEESEIHWKTTLVTMTNNKQQTAVDVAELAMKLYPFSNSERNAFITGYNKAREMYEDKMEAETIKQCATLSTIKASAYEDGFNDGYMKASRTTGTTESGIATGNNISTTGTTTNITHFCEVFEPAYKPSPKVATITCVPCKKCGKSLWQHAKWTNTI